MATLFTRIIQGEIPCYKLAEDQNYFAFLDIRPLTRGHALAIPKQESDYIFRMEDQLLAGLMIFAKRVALALEQEVHCARIGVAVIGLEVPHTHVHLVPINDVGDINFRKPPVDISPSEMEDLAVRVSRRLSGQ